MIFSHFPLFTPSIQHDLIYWYHKRSLNISFFIVDLSFFPTSSQELQRVEWNERHKKNHSCYVRYFTHHNSIRHIEEENSCKWINVYLKRLHEKSLKQFINVSLCSMWQMKLEGEIVLQHVFVLYASPKLPIWLPHFICFLLSHADGIYDYYCIILCFLHSHFLFRI